MTVAMLARVAQICALAVPLAWPTGARATARGVAGTSIDVRTYEERLTSPFGRRNVTFGLAQELDGPRALVGAPGAGDGAGAAFLFTRSSEGFGEATRLVPDERVAEGRFGWAVALEGDTAAVGAIGEDDGAGALYVFRRSDDGWRQEARLVGSDREAGARFGWAVALLGETIVVGAPRAKDDSGAAYVFQRAGSTWSEQQRFAGLPESLVGWSVALGQDTLFLGEPGVAGGRGQGELLARVGDFWSVEARFLGADGDAAFGVGADMDGDTLIVGAEEEDAGALDSGAAHVFVREAGGWRHEATLAAASPSEDAHFGLRVAVSGDLAMVGAPLGRSPIDGEETGAAHVFRRRQGTWTEVAMLVADSGAEDEFGHVAVDGTTALVGAPLHDEPRKDAGAAYVYDLAGLGLGTERASGVQVSPDRRRVLISKDVDGALGAERWAIVRDLSDETVTGNVFPADGGAPAFVFCETVARTGDEVALGCSTAEPCLSSPCLATDWAGAGTVRVPAAFLEPPTP